MGVEKNVAANMQDVQPYMYIDDRGEWAWGYEPRWVIKGNSAKMDRGTD